MNSAMVLSVSLIALSLPVMAQQQAQQPAQQQAQPQPQQVQQQPLQMQGNPELRMKQRRQVSLREALQLAAKQSPEVAAARAQAQVTRVGVARAYTAWKPQLTATGTFDHTNGFATFDLAPLATAVGLPATAFGPPVTINAQNNEFATFQLTQPLLTPQGLFLPGVAKSAAEAADRGSDDAREQVLLNVARTYLGLQGLEGLLAAARDAEKVALAREQDARAQISAGTAVEVSLLRAQSETAGARVNIANFEGQKAAFLPLLEAFTGEAIEPLPAAEQNQMPSGREADQPWENNFGVRSATAAVKASEGSVRYDEFLWMPSIFAGAKESYNSNAGFAGKNWIYDLTINVSVPLYDAGLRYVQKSEDEARLSQAMANLAATRARARSNWLGAKANVASAEVALQQAVIQEQLAARTQEQVSASYKAGVATSLDLSDADNRKFAASSQVAQARTQLDVRKAELAATEGRIYEFISAQ